MYKLLKRGDSAHNCNMGYDGCLQAQQKKKVRVTKRQENFV